MGDMDGDGKADIITTNYNANTVSVLRNISTSGSITSGSLAAKADFAVGTNPNCVAVGDIDGDGMPDVAVSNYTSNNVSVLWNDPGHLAPHGSVGADGSVSMCVGSSVSLSSTIPGGSWISSNSSVAEVDENTGIVKGITTGRAEITYTADNVTEVTMVIVNPVPDAVTITANPGTAIQPGQKVTLTAAVQNGAIATYQWQLNGNNIKGATGPAYTSNQLANGDVVSCTVSSENCGDVKVTGSVKMSVYGAITSQGILPGSSIRVVPNPSSGAFVIRGSLGTTADQEVAIEITDMLGRVIYRDNVVARNGNIEQPITLSGVQNGMYIIALQTGAESKMFHMVIEQ
jgi:hypothetical protein